MIEIKIGNVAFYKGCHLFKALTVFKRLEHMGQEPTANGDDKVMVRWSIILANL